jgi:hypothetical protein
MKKFKKFKAHPWIHSMVTLGKGDTKIKHISQGTIMNK